MMEFDDPWPDPNEEVPSPNKKEIFVVKNKLGSGAYGAVYKVQRKSDFKIFAMKCEKMSIKKPVLQMDCAVMLAAMSQRSKHFAKVVDRGKMQYRFNFLVMKLLGENLWNLRVNRKEFCFTLNTAIKLAEQSLIAIENLHRSGFLHRDIKPGNFAVGVKGEEDYHTVFLLDFGLCRPFADSHKDVHAPRGKAPFRGTTRYASIAAHKEIDQCRRDDLESWLYMVFEWTSGALPWTELKADEREKVLKKKVEARTVESVQAVLYEKCPRKNYEKILKYLDGLEYVDVPDYKFIHFAITSVYKTSNIKLTDPLDYDPKEPYRGPQETPGDGTPKLETPKVEAPKVETPKPDNHKEGPNPSAEAVVESKENSEKERKKGSRARTAHKRSASVGK